MKVKSRALADSSKVLAGQSCGFAQVWAAEHPAPCMHFSEQLKRLAAEHRVRFENSRSAVGATSL
jgi:hypothetical protein